MVTTTNKTSCVGKSPTPTSKRCKNAKLSRFFKFGFHDGIKSLYIVFPHDSFQPGLLCHRLWGQPTQPPLVWARDYNHVRIVNLSWCFIMIAECNFFSWHACLMIIIYSCLPQVHDDPLHGGGPSQSWWVGRCWVHQASAAASVGGQLGNICNKLICQML